MFDFKSAKKRVDEAINPTHMFYSEIFSDLSKNNVYINQKIYKKLVLLNWGELITRFQKWMRNQNPLES